MEGSDGLDALDSTRAEGGVVDKASLVPGAVTAVRGRLVWFHDDPFLVGPNRALRYEEDGLLVCQEGMITYAGPYSSARAAVPPGATFVHYPNHVITPGFVDAHVHYTQVGMIASYGERLINWLDKYVYPEEMKYSDKGYAQRSAELFCDELLKNGTTTALVFTSTYPKSVNALFEESNRRKLRMAAGKVLMDRNAPEELCDKSVDKAMRQTRKLIERWHGKGRNVYAVMPRFPLACTGEMLKATGELWDENPDLLMHSHIAENTDEVFRGRELFPECETYLDVFRQYGLLRPGTVLAHGVHLTVQELDACHRAGAAIAHCPTSNLFLGSGLFRLRDAKTPSRPVNVGLGTDVGGGTSLSMLATMNEAYKVSALDGYPANALRLFYLATLGGARALRMDHQIGSLEIGREADFVVLDPEATPVLRKRTRTGDGSVEDLLFALAILGDDRAVEATYVAGRLSYKREQRQGDDKKMGGGTFLAWSRYDWESGAWLPDQTTSFKGWRSPAIDAYAGGLHCVYNEPDDNLKWTVYTQQEEQEKQEGEWSPPRNVAVEHGAAPSIAPYHDLLYCFYVSSDKTVHWRTRNDDIASPWSEERRIPGGMTTPVPTAVTAYNDFLHLFAVDMDRRVQWNTYCSKNDTWSGWRPLWRMEDWNSPTIAAYAGRLYVMYSPASGDDVRWTAYDAVEDEWWEHRTLSGTAGTARPKMCHYNGLLYAMGVRSTGGGRETWWASQGADLPEWSRPEPVPQFLPATAQGLGLTPYHGQLYAVYFTH